MASTASFPALPLLSAAMSSMGGTTTSLNSNSNGLPNNLGQSATAVENLLPPAPRSAFAAPSTSTSTSPDVLEASARNNNNNNNNNNLSNSNSNVNANANNNNNNTPNNVTTSTTTTPASTEQVKKSFFQTFWHNTPVRNGVLLVFFVLCVYLIILYLQKRNRLSKKKDPDTQSTSSASPSSSESSFRHHEDLEKEKEKEKEKGKESSIRSRTMKVPKLPRLHVNLLDAPLKQQSFGRLFPKHAHASQKRSVVVHAGPSSSSSDPNQSERSQGVAKGEQMDQMESTSLRAKGFKSKKPVLPPPPPPPQFHA